MQPECISAVRKLLHKIRFAERRKQTVNGALDQSGFLCQLMQRHWAAGAIHCFKQLDRTLQ